MPADPPDDSLADQYDGLHTLLVGLDAACEPVLDRVRTADAVPTIDSLREQGTAAPLRSQVPPWTPSAWPSLYTGVGPGTHGVYGFLTFDGYDYDVVARRDVRERAVWEVLSERGVESAVCNVPVTHPPEPFDGALIPGYTAPEDPECHPSGLLDDLTASAGDASEDRLEEQQDRFGEQQDRLEEYRVYRDRDAGDDPEARIAGYESLVAQRGAAFRHLLDRFEPAFGFVQFQQTDTVFHELPEHASAAERVYRAVDRELDAILEQVDPAIVLLVSDHGIGPVEGREFRVNDFLRDAGYLETVADGEGMPSWSAIARERLRDGDGGREDGEAGRADGEAGREDGEASTQDGDELGGDVATSLARRTVAAASSVGLTAQRVGAVLDRLGLADAVLERVPAGVVRAGTERVDFANSRAYCRDRIELGVRIDVEGREPDGSVAPEAYEDVRSELIEQLVAVRTPAGEPVFEDVLRREDVFDGPHVEAAPDVVVVPSGYRHTISTTLRGEQFGEPSGGWTHRRHGIVVAAGSGVDETVDLADASVFDVAPTVLATFGIPAAERMDGSVLPIVEPAGREQYPDYEASAPSASPGAEDERAGERVEDRLSAMGYLE